MLNSLQLVVGAFLLLSGCAGKPPATVVVPPLPPPAPYVLPIPDYVLADMPDAKQVQFGDTYIYVSGDTANVESEFTAALAKVRTVRPDAKSIMDVEVRIMQPECKGGTGASGFYADGIMTAFEIDGLRRVYPTSFDVTTGRACVQGFTNVNHFPVIVSTLPAALRHEFMHAIWFQNWPVEKCGNVPVYSVVEHGGLCDPY